MSDIAFEVTDSRASAPFARANALVKELAQARAQIAEPPFGCDNLT
jgi:hypothetical protein